VRVKISHASLNRHDLFSLRGITAQPEPIPFPMILGNDGAGTLEDGTPVVIYPVMGSDDWRDDETLDPRWHILSERFTLPIGVTTMSRQLPPMLPKPCGRTFASTTAPLRSPTIAI
jgi:hypothetical protein